MTLVHDELKQHLEGNQKLRNAGASNDDIKTAAATYHAACAANTEDCLNRIEGVLSNISEHLINIEVNTRANN